MNWLIKVFFKIIINKIPLFRKLFELFGLFKLGKMDSFSYSNKIYKLHFNQYSQISNCKDKVMLEMGPGDSIASAIFGYSSGFKKIYLIDVGYFATNNLDFYRNIVSIMRKQGVRVPNINDAKTLDDILSSCNAKYLINGLDSLKKIQSNSIDFVFSHSVIEHIRKRDFLPTVSELNRMMKKGGIASHCIDYQDHLSKSLNNLRFPEKIWESEIFANSGFYTNRIPAIEVHKCFKNNGFEIICEDFGRWENLPISRKFINKKFHKFSDKELINRTSYIKLKCK